MFLKQGIQQLYNLKQLKLYLQNNNLGENEDNIKYLQESFLKLKKLQHLKLNLFRNYLGENMKNL